MNRTLATALLCLLAAASACVKNPVTGKRQLSLVGEGQEIELGQQAKAEIEQTMGLYPDPGLQTYIDALGKKLAASSQRPKLPWSFGVLDDATVNAFALPGGPIFITRGLLTHIHSEAELASVLGHEIGHTAAKHQVAIMSKQQLAQVGLGVGSILLPENLQGLGQVAGAGAGLLFLKYGRDAEREADNLGYDYALQNSYDVRAMRELFRTLAAASQKETGGKGRVPEWLSTHPEPENRRAAVDERLREEGLSEGGKNLTVGRDEYFTRLQGVIFGEDPRNGFFEGSAFLHPDLKFRAQMPRGWRAINQPTAVAAISPKEDAIVQLGLVPATSAEGAAQQFFSQQGIRRGDTVVGTLNTLPVVTAYFQAQLQQGVVAGLVSFLSYDGKVYQLVSYTPAQLLPTYDAAFKQFVTGFAPLTDPKALAVQPNRLNIVTLPKQMTLAEANQAYPSVVDLATVALINGVQPDGTLQANAKYKQVVTGAAPASPSVSSR